jgi:hypothetical protein
VRNLTKGGLSSNKLSTGEIVALISEWTNHSVEYDRGNWLKGPTHSLQMMYYFSQTKPSDRGNWKYDYYHTLAFERLEEIADSRAELVLINYVDKSYCVLSPGDIVWLAKFSSRMKSNQGQVVDIVIERSENGEPRLRPYDRLRSERRVVQIRSW